MTSTAESRDRSMQTAAESMYRWRRVREAFQSLAFIVAVAALAACAYILHHGAAA